MLIRILRAILFPVFIIGLFQGIDSAKDMINLPTSYVDKGVQEFTANRVISQKVRKKGRKRTKYMLEYKSGSGYTWKEKIGYPTEGETKIEKKESVDRRVLSIPQKNTYMTIEPYEEPERYLSEKKRTGWIRIGIGILITVGYAIFAFCTKGIQEQQD